jgi:hypothetical protein
MFPSNGVDVTIGSETGATDGSGAEFWTGGIWLNGDGGGASKD